MNGLMQLAQQTMPVEHRNAILNDATAVSWDTESTSTVESVEQTIDMTDPRKLMFTIDHYCDLVSNVVLEILLKKGEGASSYPAEHLIKDVELVIDGVRIDHFNNTWLRIYDELYRTQDEREAYRDNTNFAHDDAPGTMKRFYVQIPFWFCRRPENALPMLRMYRSEVKVHVSLESVGDIPGIDDSFQQQVKAYCDFVFLDTNHRLDLVEKRHSLVVEQHQVIGHPVTIGEKVNTVSIPLNSIVNPVKMLVCVLRHPDSHGRFTSSDVCNETREVFGPVHEAKIEMNTEYYRTFLRKGSYYRHHTFDKFGKMPSVGIYPFNFSRNPRLIRPSGHVYFDYDFPLSLTLSTKSAVLESPCEPREEHQTVVTSRELCTAEVYACTYNVLDFSDSGQARLRLGETTLRLRSGLGDAGIDGDDGHATDTHVV